MLFIFVTFHEYTRDVNIEKKGSVVLRVNSSRPSGAYGSVNWPIIASDDG